MRIFIDKNVLPKVFYVDVLIRGRLYGGPKTRMQVMLNQIHLIILTLCDVDVHST